MSNRILVFCSEDSPLIKKKKTSRVGILDIWEKKVGKELEE